MALSSLQILLIYKSKCAEWDAEREEDVCVFPSWWTGLSWLLWRHKFQTFNHFFSIFVIVFIFFSVVFKEWWLIVCCQAFLLMFCFMYCRFKKNLKAFYFVHPTFRSKVRFEFCLFTGRFHISFSFLHFN